MCVFVGVFVLGVGKGRLGGFVVIWLDGWGCRYWEVCRWVRRCMCEGLEWSVVLFLGEKEVVGAVFCGGIGWGGGFVAC